MLANLEMAFRRAAVALNDERRALQYVRNVAHVDRLEDVPADMVPTCIRALTIAADVADRNRTSERQSLWHRANAVRVNARRRVAYAARKKG